MMAEAEAAVESEEIIEVKTRHLELDECRDLHQWLVDLSGFQWSDNDSSTALTHFLDTQMALVTFPGQMTREAIYCKVKWG